MKIRSWIRSRTRIHEDGMAVIVMMVLLSLILIYIAANMRVLNQLHRELKLTEDRQLRRLKAAEAAVISTSQTNAPATSTPGTAPVSP